MAGETILWVASVLCLLIQTAPPGGRSKKPNPATTASPSIQWHTAGEITIPFEYFKQHIYVPVSLNGKPGYVFMLDSGANRNILDLRIARKLGKVSRLDQQTNIGFGDGLIYTARAVDVDASIDNVPVAQSMSVLDMNRFAQHFGHVTDGMLGYPFFKRFVVELDFQRKLLTLLPADGPRYRGSGIRVTLKPSNDFVVMPVAIGAANRVSRKADMIVDSGSNMTLMLYERYAHPLQVENSLAHAVQATGYGLNGPYPMSLGNIDLFRIGDSEARNVSVAFLNRENEEGPARHIPGAIGTGILQSFRAVVFDVPRREIIFETKTPQWQPGVERTYSAPK